MAHPNPLQMTRFWHLVTEGRITSERFEEFLKCVEPPAEAWPTWTPTGDLSVHGRRLRLAEAGTSYLDVLVPKEAGDQAMTRVHNALRTFCLYVDDPGSESGYRKDPVDTIQKLVAVPTNELRCKNLGPKGIAYLKKILGELELSLGMDPRGIEAAFRPDPAPERPQASLAAAAS